MYSDIVEALRKRGLKLTFAESCTGGLLAKTLTDTPGASDVFDGSVVTYANSTKRQFLCVSADTLEKYGAVSRQTAYEMASGVRLIFGADVGVSVTGVAGPGGGTEEKPVGLVYIGISTAKKTSVYRMKARENGSRSRIRGCVCSEVRRLLCELLGV